MIGLLELLVLVVLPAVVLWFWAFIDVLRSDFEGNDKLVWFMAVLFVPVIGPIAYLIIGRKRKKRSPAAGPLVVLALSFGLPFSARADMGRITVSSEAVLVSEDAQKAIILHNFSEEVLILGTDLKATARTGIIRFIPFPSEPSVALAPAGAFEMAAAMIKKYGLRYQEYFYSKGGSTESSSESVELKLNKRLGAHDLTIIKVNDIAAFRDWVNDYLKKKGLPAKAEYRAEEAVVADYVKRGIVHFVLDFVEISPETRFVEPVAYRFKSKPLYYPLLTSNTFGGEGTIELIVLAPVTLCAPGNGPFDLYSGALYREPDPRARRPYNQRPLCLGLPVKASTSALLVKEEKALEEIFPGAGSFFAGRKTLIQAVRYAGKYSFENDIFVDAASGRPEEMPGIDEAPDAPGSLESRLTGAVDPKKCAAKGERGPCKAMFERYYYDAAAKSCKAFFWGGCGGVEPFESEAECLKCR